MYGPRRRTTSEGSSHLQRLETPDSNRQGASSQRHSMNDSTPISVEKERTILRKHSGDMVPRSRSLAHKVACSEVDITGFWSRRLSSQKRAVTSSRMRDVSPIQAVNDTDTRPSLLSSPRPILQMSPSVRKPFRPLPSPPVARPQSQSLPQHAALGPPVIPHLADQAQPMALPASALSLDYLKADIHGDDHIYNKDITKLTSMPSLPAASLAPSVTPPSSPSQVIKEDDKEKRRFPHFGFSRLVSSGLGESRKADYAPAPALAPVLPELRPLTPLPPISIVPPIYDSHTLQTQALVLKRQKSSKSIKSVKYVDAGRSVHLQKSQNNLDMRKGGQCRTAGPTQIVDLGTRGDQVQDKSVSNSAVASAPSFTASVALPLSFMPSSSSLPSSPSHVRVRKERGSENDKERNASITSC
ncbi:hypothetical protein DFH11DRAFT_1246522 [Phellopilus nigrolimitatus]|nr:hypothetical protein DFH11DRAFT_1246522 [Phellopilus nigrolimitatus]